MKNKKYQPTTIGGKDDKKIKDRLCNVGLISFLACVGIIFFLLTFAYEQACNGGDCRLFHEPYIPELNQILLPLLILFTILSVISLGVGAYSHEIVDFIIGMKTRSIQRDSGNIGIPHTSLFIIFIILWILHGLICAWAQDYFNVRADDNTGQYLNDNRYPLWFDILNFIIGYCTLLFGFLIYVVRDYDSTK